MQKSVYSVFLLTLFFVAGIAALATAQEGGALAAFGAGSTADYYHNLIGVVTGNWQEYGELFTFLQGEWFWKIFLGIITAIPAVFFLHYMIVGAKHFDHDGPQIYFFSLLTRVVHFIAAISFTLLAITGLMIVFGSFLGGGSLIRIARNIHLVSAIVFVLPCVLMFITMVKHMFPQLHDIHWMLILGGYLSKKKKPVPASKFNAGQKMYFWFAIFGGGVMAYSGYLIWGMSAADVETVVLFTIIHNVLGMGIVAFYLTHVYMSVFAIAGSLESMKTGYKPKEEVDILHSRYRYE